MWDSGDAERANSRNWISNVINTYNHALMISEDIRLHHNVF